MQNGLVLRHRNVLLGITLNVIYGSGSATGMHVSGHGNQEELKLMLTLMKPKYFVPVHGEFRMLYQHRLLAKSVGVDEENIFIVNNGETVEIENKIARKGGKIPAGTSIPHDLDKKQFSCFRLSINHCSLWISDDLRAVLYFITQIR